MRELIEECRGKDGIIERFIVSREMEIMDLFEEMWTLEGSVRAYARYQSKISKAEGLAEGEAKVRATIFKNMLDKGYSPEEIEEITGVSV